MQNDESVKSDRRMLYESKVSDIDFFKQQQWRATNYAVLSYAALIALAVLKTDDLLPVETFVAGSLVV